MIEVVWTPAQTGDPEPYFKAYGVDGCTIRPFYAYNRDELGRRYFQIPDSEKNRELARTQGPAWSIVTAQPAPVFQAASAVQPLLTEDEKRQKVTEILKGLGIQVRSNMKYETLVHKLPVGMRGGFL